MLFYNSFFQRFRIPDQSEDIIFHFNPTCSWHAAAHPTSPQWFPLLRSCIPTITPRVNNADTKWISDWSSNSELTILVWKTFEYGTKWIRYTLTGLFFITAWWKCHIIRDHWFHRAYECWYKSILHFMLVHKLWSPCTISIVNSHLCQSFHFKLH